MRSRDAEVLAEPDHRHGEICRGRRRAVGKRRRAPEPGHVDGDHVALRCESLGDRPPDDAGAAEPVDQQQRGSLPGTRVVQAFAARDFMGGSFSRRQTRHPLVTVRTDSAAPGSGRREVAQDETAGCSRRGQGLDGAEAAATQPRLDRRPEPKLLLVFASDALDPRRARRIAGCSGVPLIGCSTAGEISTQGPGDESVVVVGLGGPGFSATTAVGRGASDDLRTAGENAAGCLRGSTASTPTGADHAPRRARRTRRRSSAAPTRSPVPRSRSSAAAPATTCG